MRDISIVLYDDNAPAHGFAGWMRGVIGWPARVLDARRTMAMLGELSEREWRDIEPGRRERACETAFARDDDPAERRARALAIRAWYGRHAQAA